MSYHILHQFDEQWLAELKQDTKASNRRDFADSFMDEREPARRARRVTRESQRWAVFALAILVATFALLFALDANRRTEALQQRLNALETTTKK
jgi:type VI protein secretion system component VasF